VIEGAEVAGHVLPEKHLPDVLPAGGLGVQDVPRRNDRDKDQDTRPETPEGEPSPAPPEGQVEESDPRRQHHPHRTLAQDGQARRRERPQEPGRGPGARLRPADQANNRNRQKARQEHVRLGEPGLVPEKKGGGENQGAQEPGGPSKQAHPEEVDHEHRRQGGRGGRQPGGPLAHAARGLGERRDGPGEERGFRALRPLRPPGDHPVPGLDHHPGLKGEAALLVVHQALGVETEKEQHPGRENQQDNLKWGVVDSHRRPAGSFRFARAGGGAPFTRAEGSGRTGRLVKTTRESFRYLRFSRSRRDPARASGRIA